MANVLVWADIPVRDLARARKFYEHLLGNPIPEMPGAEGHVALLMPPGTGSPDDVSADLAMDTGVEPSTTHGVTIYLSAKGDIDGMLARAVEAGGKVLGQKGFMGENIGWLAWIEDSEGNRIGLHSNEAAPV